MMTRYVLTDLPIGVKGFVKEDEAGNSIYVLNSRYTREMNLETVQHEDEHVACGDLHSEESASAIEIKRHKR